MYDNVIIGTSASDTIVGSDLSDEILGLEGDDVLEGKGGKDRLDGGAGNDTLNGGAGDDEMLGGPGNDYFELASGDDSADGGEGDDVFVLGGASGNYVLISDTSGNADKLDFINAASGAVIDLTPGGLSSVDGRTIELFGPSDKLESPLEMVLLEDLSGSFYDDLFTLKLLKDDLVDYLSSLSAELKLGLTSFIDKPTSPFGSASDHEYQTELELTTDFEAWKAAVDALTTGSGNDGPEAQLTALMQVGLRSVEVGWSSDALKVVILTTDAEPHVAGDNPVAPNNGDDVTDGPRDNGTGEDYPSLEQVKDALLAGGVTPIFAVTSVAIRDYEAIVDAFGFGSVVELAPDSSNLIEAIAEGIFGATATVIEKTRGTYFGDEINGNYVANIIRGYSGNDIMRGGGGADKLFGGTGSDSISGNDGEDRLFGRGDNDLLNGGKGSDVLKGGHGNDRLTGGSEDDVFIFARNADKDVITDFENGADRIRLSAFGIDKADFDAIVAPALSVSGADTYLDLTLLGGNGGVLIKGLSLVDADVGDFIL